MLTVLEAQQKILTGIVPLGTEKISTPLARSRTLSQNVIADRPLPPFNRVAMDGYAVQSTDFNSPKTQLQVIGQIQAGVPTDLKLEAGEAIHVMTGAPLPEGADAVVKIEQTEMAGNMVTLHEKEMEHGLNIAAVGEDAAKGKRLLSRGQVLTSAGLAVCASVGLDFVSVFKQPVIKVISTGTELISPGQEPLPHQIRDCNSISVRSLSNQLGIDAEFLGICDDNPDTLSSVIKSGLESDILILSGGVSMGEFDLVPGILAKLGVREIFHKARLKPGKPIWYGTTDKGTSVFGLPGNPVSVQVNYKLFVEPAVGKLSGVENYNPQFLHLPIEGEIVKQNQLEQYFPAKLGAVAGQTIVLPTPISGSGDFSNLANSTGLIRCPIDCPKLESGSIVQFLPWGVL
ncbi:MAG: molybdopterin molybdotransferase MoeA [Proteobacteria bacterium]|nr:molybdopterin molybdotransferase MoeA [Pseudomonadota bacterium]